MQECSWQPASLCDGSVPWQALCPSHGNTHIGKCLIYPRAFSYQAIGKPQTPTPVFDPGFPQWLLRLALPSAEREGDRQSSASETDRANPCRNKHEKPPAHSDCGVPCACKAKAVAGIWVTSRQSRVAVVIMTCVLAARINAYLQHRIDSRGPSLAPGRIACGLRTSPTFLRGKVGCTWPRYWICTADASSDGP